MENTQEKVAVVVAKLRSVEIICDLFGGWAEEVLGLRKPSAHGDIDMLYRNETFKELDSKLRDIPEFEEVPLKRFRHKRAFRFYGTLCEITLVQEREGPITLFWGDVPFRWDTPLLHRALVDVCGADFGFMIWDGKSPGTVLNVLRLIKAGKKAVLLNVPEKSPVTFKTGEQWSAFLARCSADLRENLRDRATSDEWEIVDPSPQADLLETVRKVEPTEDSPTKELAPEENPAANVNAALASGDASLFIDALGRLARAKKGGMTQLAKETGLARESLYRALGKDGNPELITILKVISALGLTLETKMQTNA